jgi:hypothetical protein
MRKWMLITVLALGLGLFWLPGHAIAELRVKVTQLSPSTAAPHGTKVTIGIDVDSSEMSTYYYAFEVKKPNEMIEYHSGTGIGIAGASNWTITNGNEASQLISITAKAYDENDHSNLIYIDTKNYQIQINHTPLTDWIVTASPACEATGTRVKRCSICNTIVETETIPATGHSYETIITPGTCITRYESKEVCTVCGNVRNIQQGSYGPHNPYILKTMPTCITEGTEIQYCSVCNQVLNTQSIPATGVHTPGAYTVTTPATCGGEGTETQYCTVCGQALNTQPIPATGLHTPGAYAVTTPATCGNEGTQTQTCTACGKVLNTRPIPATGLHTPNGNWTHTAGTTGADSRHTGACKVCGARMEEACIFQRVVTPPSCKTAGNTIYTCTLCGYTYTGSPVKATGHTPGEWVTVKEATNKKTGLSELRCAVCGEVIGSREIKRKSEWWRDNTACAFGLRIRDEKPDVTDKWYMLAAVDLKKDGVQEFPLIASNAYVVGTVYVTVDKGAVKARYELGTNEAVVKEEYLAWFGSMDDMKTAEPEDMTSQAVPLMEPVNIAEMFPGADSVLLFLRLKLDYDIYADGVKRFYEGQYQ